MQLRTRLRAALDLCAPEDVAMLRSGYAPLDDPEEDAWDPAPGHAPGQAQGEDPRDGAERFVDDALRMAEEMEVDRPEDIAALICILLASERKARAAQEAAPAAPDWTAEETGRPVEEMIDYAVAALNRPEGSGAARMGLVDAWLAARAPRSPELAAIHARMDALRTAVAP